MKKERSYLESHETASRWPFSLFSGVYFFCIFCFRFSCFVFSPPLCCGRREPCMKGLMNTQPRGAQYNMPEPKHCTHAARNKTCTPAVVHFWRDWWGSWTKSCSVSLGFLGSTALAVEWLKFAWCARYVNVFCTLDCSVLLFAPCTR